MSQTEIVNRTGIDRSTLADVVKRMIRKGLLHRRRSKTDARAYQVTLTERGSTALKAVMPRTVALEKRLLSMLGESDRAHVLSVLKSMANIDPAALKKT